MRATLLSWKKGQRMGIVNFGVPAPFVENLKTRLKITSFFETGTFQGETTLWAASKFDSVVTVEASQAIYDSTRERFVGVTNISAYCEDSRVLMRRLLPTLPPTIFWLDAHWCGDGRTEGLNDECPVLSELEIIKPFFKDHVVLIDDARYFLTKPPAPHKPEHWPSVSEILSVLLTDTLPHVQIFEDVIVLAPSWARNIVQPVVSGYVWR